LREDDEEMKEQRREDQKGDAVKPVEKAIQLVEPSCGREDVKGVKSQRDEVEENVRHGKGLL
jgi:hypothetical protein